MRRRAHGGFTLLELMVVLAILAIVGAVGTPALRKVSLVQRVKAAGAELQAALLEARSEAIARNADIVVTPVSAGWAEGWSVTVGGTVIKRGNPQRAVTITGPANIVFRSNGRAGSVTPLSVSASGLTTDEYRCVKLHLNGRSHVDRGACS